ncbi:Mitochondrial distribution and morphology protein 32 [Wickerhamomyces ciferrii]|uniref:Mitochondrial distribution and morphology protein 32 n=1 Tax=Wickerhamomyces ciferrii (strain ATCC 14091 / BCRC 22168 / CBS 111 / JCM 3599 / NBRC 0793 / NRRL Y-1031 F-60-10) TaxID=1206466 RepID=K0KLI4_WICCF|nr:Mitochondrial distribution and morphology protein 32 [Wickerhamomyces ciferrii]CCH43831.1 Mitochondrial distribution and morphology protein 32 [Wickerhamomyces ciferrii]
MIPPKKSITPNNILTKEVLLSQATSSWERFVIKSKWFLIKGYRPFNIDEISAFFSWFILSHILWIILGTTTFFSLLFYGLNSLFAKELVGKVMGKFITYLNPSFEIKFKDAVVPEWEDGMIDFKKVIIKTVDDSGLKLDLKLDHLKLTLSFNKWYNQKGIIDKVEIHGMTGIIDRSDYLEGDDGKNEIDWFNNEDYELSGLKIVDSFFKVLPKGFTSENNIKPLEFAIYSCEIPKIRIKWLLADFFNASSITGSVNDSLFAIHKRQHKYAYVSDIEDDLNPWKRITRIRLDPLDVDVLGLTSSQFNWIVDGKADITCDIMSPVEEDDGSLSSNYIVIDFKIQFNDLKAKYPIEEPMTSNGEKLISLKDLKPIISYVNNKRLESFEKMETNFELPSLNFRIVKKINELEKISTLSESNFLDLISNEIYIDWLKHVHEYEIEQRNKRIAQWSKSFASQLLVVGIGAMV